MPLFVGGAISIRKGYVCIGDERGLSGRLFDKTDENIMLTDERVTVCLGMPIYMCEGVEWPNVKQRIHIRSICCAAGD